MRINAPISRISEVEPLIAAGAGELYCGIVPQEWVARFNTGGVNRRYFGNLSSFGDLTNVIETAHSGGARLSLVLNAQHYGARHYPDLLEIAKQFHSLGCDAVIVADLALIALLHDKLPGLAVHASSVANIRNTQAARMLLDLGVKRLILPRDVTLNEIERICRSLPQIEIEAFILNDGCVFEEGLCHSVHLPSKLGGPICTDNFQMRYQTSRKGATLSSAMERTLADNDSDYKKWLWYRFGCGFSTTTDGHPYGPCGLCAIHRLHAAGVTAIKIAGREGATERKVKSVEMVRLVLQEVLQGTGEDCATNVAVGIRNTLDHCRTGYMCYYPEVRLADETH